MSIPFYLYDVARIQTFSALKKKKIKCFAKLEPSYLCDSLLPYERTENAYNLHNQTEYSMCLWMGFIFFWSVVYMSQLVNN
jgi:hypothetical protein